MKIEIDTTKLVQKITENPVAAGAVAAGLLSGAAKLMNANTARKNSKTWKREVDRRNRKK